VTAIFRAAKYLIVAYALALGAGLLHLGSWDEPVALLVLPFLWVWVMGAGLCAAVCVRLSKEAEGAGWFLAVQTAIVVWTAWSWYDLAVVHPHSMNGIGLGITIPAMQYLLFGAAWLVALAAGWRRRPDWP
jgi:hypothetical protein